MAPHADTERRGRKRQQGQERKSRREGANHRRMLSSLSPQTRRNISKEDRVRVGTADYEWLLMVATK